MLPHAGNRSPSSSSIIGSSLSTRLATAPPKVSIRSLLLFFSCAGHSSILIRSSVSCLRVNQLGSQMRPSARIERKEKYSGWVRLFLLSVGDSSPHAVCGLPTAR